MTIASLALSLLVLVGALGYALGWVGGSRRMARRIRSGGEPCWRCRGTGVERSGS